MTWKKDDGGPYPPDIFSDHWQLATDNFSKQELGNENKTS
jgi:hypothetical protein